MTDATLTPLGYRPRVVDDRLDVLLNSFGGVEITGAKWCGKTWTALAHARSADNLDDAETFEAALVDPRLVLQGEEPHLVDEWQEAPRIWDAARRFIDAQGGRKGQLILTGSSAPKSTDIHHSGTGRFGKVRMRPMSLFESGNSTGEISLRSLFDGEFVSARANTEVAEVARWCCRGGWPSIIELEDEYALETPKAYIESVLEVSVPSAGKSSETARRLMRALAANACQAVTYATLAKDMGGGDEQGAPTRITIESYNDLLEDLYLIESLPGWEPPLRSKRRLRTKPKRTFADPSLAAALLGATPSRLQRDMQTLGCLFENLCLRDVRVYFSAVGEGRVSYFRNDKGLEVDAVLELGDGRWGAFEVKLSEGKVTDESAGKLLKMRDMVLSNAAAQIEPPSFLALLVGSGKFAYRRDDGVLVVPIALLGP